MSNLSYIKKGSGKVLLLLHGYGSNKESFNSQINYFSKYFCVYSIDLSGFGQNPPITTAYCLDDYINDLVVFLNEHEIGKFSVIAHSFGVRLLLKSEVLRYKTDKMVLTGGAGIKPKRSLKYYFKVWLYKIVKRFSKGRVKEKFGSKEYKSLNDVQKRSFVKIVNEHLDYTLPTIKNPTLIINGKQDKTTPKYQAKKLHKGIKGSSLYFINGAGHYAFAQKPTEFNAIVKEFLLG